MRSATHNPERRQAAVGICLIAGLAAACFTAVPRCVVATERQVDDVYAAKARGEIDIDVSAGTVRVIGEPRLDIAVNGRLGTDVVAWDVFQEDRYARFRAVPPSPPGEGSADLDVDLVFRVPEGSTVNLRSIEGRLEIENVRGPVAVHTATASTRLRGAPRKVDVTTVAGAVDAMLETPDVEIKSVSGSVSVAGRIENLIAETVDTPLVVDADIVVEGFLRSVTGSVRLNGNLESTARLRVETSSGAVHLNLPADLAGTFQVETSTGDLHRPEPAATTETGPDPIALQDVRGRRHAAWAIGSAPRRVDVRTLDGDVTIAPGEAK